MKQSWLDRAVNKVFGIYGPEHGTDKVTWYESADSNDDGEVWTGYGAPPLPAGVTEDDLFRYKLSAYKDKD